MLESIQADFKKRLKQSQFSILFTLQTSQLDLVGFDLETSWFKYNPLNTTLIA